MLHLTKTMKQQIEWQTFDRISIGNLKLQHLVKNKVAIYDLAA